MLKFKYLGQSLICFAQSDEELKRREDAERAQMEMRERAMFRQRLRQQRLESEADSKWLQQEEQNIELPFSPVRVMALTRAITKIYLLMKQFLVVCREKRTE